MISAGEVGAIFTIKDEATGAIDHLVEQFNKLQEVIDRIEKSLSAIGDEQGAFSKLEESFKALGTSGEDAQKIITEAFGKVDSSIEGTALKVDALGRSLSEAALAAERIHINPGAVAGGAAFGAAVGGEVGGHHGGHTNPGDPGFLGAGGFDVFGMPELIAGSAAADGIWKAATLDSSAATALLQSGQFMQPGQERAAKAAIDQFRGIALDTSVTSGFGSEDIASGMNIVSRLLPQDLPWDQRMKFMQAIMPDAVLEARQKGVEVGGEHGSLASLVEISHMMGIDPSDLGATEKAVDDIRRYSVMSPLGIEQFKGSLSYAMPQLTAEGITDPDTILRDTAMMQRFGIMRTKSGTWERNFYEGALANGKEQHDSALSSLGLIDSSGNATWEVKNADGSDNHESEDLNIAMKMGKAVAAIRAQAGGGEAGNAAVKEALEHAFGKQGSGFADMLLMPNFDAQLSGAQGAAGGNNMTAQEQLDWLKKVDPKLQMESVWQELQKVLTDMGEKLMPDTLAVLKDIDSMLKMFNWGTTHQSDDGIILNPGEPLVHDTLGGIWSRNAPSWLGGSPATGGGSSLPHDPVGGLPSSSLAHPSSGVASRGGHSTAFMTPENAESIRQTAAALGVDPVDLATAMSYETEGTFDPHIKGLHDPRRGSWGNFEGLIQFGGREQLKYGYTSEMSFDEEMKGPVAAYLKDRGVKPGMGIHEIYEAINGGSVGHITARDFASGLTPDEAVDSPTFQAHAVRARNFMNGNVTVNVHVDGKEIKSATHEVLHDMVRSASTAANNSPAGPDGQHSPLPTDGAQFYGL